MTAEEIEAARYQLSFTAGMNQRIHQDRAQHWETYDRACRIATGVSAFFGAILSVAAMTSQFWVVPGLLLSILSAVAAVFLNVSPFAQRERDHLGFLARWTDLREDVDAVQFMKRQDEKVAALARLEQKCTRLCGAEPKISRSIIEQHEKDERESRTAA